MGVYLRVKENLERLEGILRNFQQENKRRTMEAIGQHVVASVLENFEVGGRPKRWKPLSPATLIAEYRRKGRKIKTKKGAPTKGYVRFAEGKKILVLTGHLRQSIEAEASSEKVEVGTNLPYAAIHQFGGYAGRGRKVYIPARPYLLLQREDEEWIRRFVKRRFFG